MFIYDLQVTVLQVAGELIRLLSVQMSALKPLVVPLAEYLENLWSETREADPSRCTILEVSNVVTTEACLLTLFYSDKKMPG